MDSSLIKEIEDVLFPPERLVFKPLASYLPFNYSVIPVEIRTLIAKLVLRRKPLVIENTLANHKFEKMLGRYLMTCFLSNRHSDPEQREGEESPEILRLKPQDDDSKVDFGTASSNCPEFTGILNHFKPLFLNDKFILLTHDVERLRFDKRNIFKIAALEENLGFRSVWNFVALLYKWDHNLISHLKDNGHEIGLHGFYHDNKMHLRSDRDLGRLFEKIKSRLERYEIKGGRVPSWFVDQRLLRLFSRYFTYDTSMQDVFLSEASMLPGCGSVRPYFIRDIVEIPTNINYDAYYLFGKNKKTNIVEFWAKKALNIAAIRGLTVCLTHPNKTYLYGEKRLAEYHDFLKELKNRGFQSILPSKIVGLMSQR